MVLIRVRSLLGILLGGAILSSCSSNTFSSGHIPTESEPMTVYIQTFSNMTTTPEAGKSVTLLLRSELMRHPEFHLVPAEEIPFSLPRGVSATNLSPSLRDRLHSLGVFAILSGSVIEYAYRSELESQPVVGMNWTMTDLFSGQVLWSVSLSGVGSCFLGCSQTLTSLSNSLISREVARFVTH